MKTFTDTENSENSESIGFINAALTEECYKDLESKLKEQTLLSIVESLTLSIMKVQKELKVERIAQLYANCSSVDQVCKLTLELKYAHTQIMEDMNSAIKEAELAVNDSLQRLKRFQDWAVNLTSELGES